VGGGASGAFKIAFHLSTNAVFGDADDFVLAATRSVNSLAAGASDSATTTLTVPSATHLGNYFVCAMADNNDSLTESDETNNALCTAATIQITRPDLVMTNVSPNAATVNAGATLSVTDTVANQGAVSSGNFRIAYHLSTDVIYGNSDDVAISTTRGVPGPFAAGATNTATTNLTIPGTTPSGAYYLCAMANDNGSVAESDETNNTRCLSRLAIQVVIKPVPNQPSENGYGFFVKRLSDNSANFDKSRQDGIPDFIVSKAQSAGHGAVYVYSGKDESLIFQINGTGWSYAVDAGDLDKDGVPDLFVGDSTTGTANAYSGLDGSLLTNLSFHSNGASDGFGTSVAAIGDINGDGVPDLIVGAPGGNYVDLYSGAEGSPIARIDSPDGDGGFGLSVSSAGDVNGDGTPDFIVGAPSASPGGKDGAGSAFVYSGQRGTQGDFPLLYRLDGEHAGDGFGGCCGAVDSVGDLNGDGTDDLAVAASTASPDGMGSAGSIYFFDGATGSPLQRPDGLGPLRLDGEASGDRLGGALCGCGWIAAMGDLNGDGYPDFMAGESGATINGEADAGRVLIFSGYDASVLFSIDNPAIDLSPHNFGVSGAFLGDLDKDGTIEILIGSGEQGGNNPGMVYLMSLDIIQKVQVTQLPDLIISAVSADPSTVNPGDALAVSTTVENQSLFSAGNFSIAFRLSLNTVYGDDDDVAITATRTVASLAAGADDTGPTSLTIPSSILPGNYYVCAKADSGVAVAESVETNNTLCSATTITVQ
jgi:hypothetical protein